LESSRKRSELWRKKLASNIEKGLPCALEKKRRHKKAKKAHYLKRKKQGQVNTLKACWRSRCKVKWIKEKLILQENINGYWVPWRRGKWTPLGIAIKLGDLGVVRWLLEEKASPSQYCTQTLIVKPLDLAADENKSELVQILLESDGLRGDCKSRGALHLSIKNRMFKVIKGFLTKGYDLNESYLNQTPLGASLTCRKTKSGDARLVKLLLDANADVLKPSKLSHSAFGRGELTELVGIARAYSNAKCVLLIEAAYNAAKNQ